MAIESQQAGNKRGILLVGQSVNLTAKNAINNTDKGQIVAGRDAILSVEVG
ncbi:MAG: hypothetical protein AB8W37_10505 [Arsenophonus endosymbiont of Dermacentor nuttalli]